MEITKRALGKLRFIFGDRKSRDIEEFKEWYAKNDGDSFIHLAFEYWEDNVKRKRKDEK